MARCTIAPDDVVNEINELASSLNKEEKRFFDAWLLGSLSRQDRKWKTTRNRLLEDKKTAEFQSELFKKDVGRIKQRAADEGWPPEREEAALNELRNLRSQGAWLDRSFKAELDRAQKSHFSTRPHQFTFALSAVDPHSVKEYGRRYNELIQATKKKSLSENEVRALLNRKDVNTLPDLEKATEPTSAPPGISTLNEAPIIELRSDNLP